MQHWITRAAWGLLVVGLPAQTPQLFAPNAATTATREQSALFPALDLVNLWRIVLATSPMQQADAVRAFRQFLRKRPRRS